MNFNKLFLHHFFLIRIIRSEIAKMKLSHFQREQNPFDGEDLKLKLKKKCCTIER